jgi:outer membrane protein assembly factor BamB
MIRPHLSALLIGCLSLTAFAQDWSRFRGPNGAGLADAAAIPDKWSDSDYRWKATLPGPGHSSPCVIGNRLFLTCCDAKTAARTILGINVADGSTLWRRDYPSQTYRQHTDNSYAASTPAADADNIYVCWTTPEEYSLLALSHDGKDLWRVNLGRFTSPHGSGTSPVLFEDLVIVTNDQENTESFILAVDRKTGQTRWKSPPTWPPPPLAFTSPRASPLSSSSPAALKASPPSMPAPANSSGRSITCSNIA